MLRDARYIQQLRTPINRPNDYVLAQRGMNELVAARDFEPRRVSTPRSVRQYRPHDTALSDFTVTLDLAIRDMPSAELINQRAILHRSTRQDIRTHRGWPTTISYHGEMAVRWLRPDRIVGISFANRPVGKNERYFAVELDQGTEMHNPSAAVIAATSFKLLAYEATFVQDVLNPLLGISYLYKLFLTPGLRRRDNMVMLAQNIVTDGRAAASMLFAVQTPPPAVGAVYDLSELVCVNGLGKEVRLPL